MIRKHWLITAAAFFGVGAVLGLLNLIGPFLAFHIAAIAQQRPPQRLMEASVEAESVWPDPLFAAPAPPGVPNRTTLRTLLDFKYVTPIDVNQTADISVVLRQELDAERPPPGYPRTYEVGQLKWPVTLRLEGPGFDWTSNDIPLKQDTPLPATEHWVPRAKVAGEYVMRFPLRDINHAAESPGGGSVSDTVKVTVNGASKDARGSDDVTLPISIWTHDMPARWWDRVTFYGSAISGLASLMAIVFGTGWGTELFRAMRRRTSRL
jgi:hypothetical protein